MVLKQIWIISMLNKYTCPVCGYNNLDEAPYDNFGCPSYEICPCCGVEFGYDDSGKSHELLRDNWIRNGFKWFSKYNKPPKGWSPVKQLKDAKLWSSILKE